MAGIRSMEEGERVIIHIERELRISTMNLCGVAPLCEIVT